MLRKETAIHREQQIMEQKELRAKLNGILQAIAAGRSCEEILASDQSLSYRHIFHAVAEAPTTFWDRSPAEKAAKRSPPKPGSPRTPAKQRTD
jgi:hypothetical protein